MNWNRFRRDDGSIDLEQVFDCRVHGLDISFMGRQKASAFLGYLERMQKVDSRQVAALAVAQAMLIAEAP